MKEKIMTNLFITKTIINKRFDTCHNQNVIYNLSNENIPNQRA